MSTGNVFQAAGMAKENACSPTLVQTYGSFHNRDEVTLYCDQGS